MDMTSRYASKQEETSDAENAVAGLGLAGLLLNMRLSVREFEAGV